MNREQIKAKLDVAIQAIKANSKDVEVAVKLITDLLSYKGLLDHEPTILHLPVSEEEDSFDGSTFRMIVMKDGTAVYHVRGGMDIVCKPNLFSLNQTITSIVKDSHDYKRMSDEEKNSFDSFLQISSNVLNIPMIAFSDANFMIDTAVNSIKFLKKNFDENMNKDLQEETVEEDMKFKESTLAVEDIKKSLNAEQSKS